MARVNTCVFRFWQLERGFLLQENHLLIFCVINNYFMSGVRFSLPVCGGVCVCMCVCVRTDNLPGVCGRWQGTEHILQIVMKVLKRKKKTNC